MKLRTLFGRCTRALLVASLLASLFVALPAQANPGGDNASSAIPQVLPITNLAGSLDATSSDVRDVYAITLASGQTVDVSVAGTGTPDFDLDLFLYSSSVGSIDETTTIRQTWSGGPTATEHFTFMAANAGTYLIDVHAWRGAGTYTLDAGLIPAVNFSLSKLSVPKSAKKGKKVKMSVTVSPAYNGWYTPIYFDLFRYENRHWKFKKEIFGTAKRTPGKPSQIFSTTYKFPKKGKWQVLAYFWDEAHKDNGPFRVKYIKIK